MTFKRLLAALLLMPWALSVQAFELRVQQVDTHAWALVGEIGPRTAQNHALNNTLGFIDTPDGVILVGSGATPAGAALIERAVRRAVHKPVRWVLNIGAQDHHWLGNSYFADQGIPIIALARTLAAQKLHVDAHLRRLRQVVPKEAAKVRPVYATRVLPGDAAELTLGGVHIRLLWPGNGHFPGDAIAWLPRQRVLYTGDFVFNDRILGVHPFTPVAQWQQAFKKIAALKPRMLVPGHGYAGDLAKAQRDTGDYLDFLVSGVKSALEDWKDLGETTDQLSMAPQFQHLKFFDGWHRANINRTYLQLESAQ